MADFYVIAEPCIGTCDTACVKACPVDCIWGPDPLDKATMPAGSKEFFDNAGSVDKTLKLYEGHFHDLLNDLGKEQVLAEIVGWINAR